MGQSLNLRAFGAVGDGVADDTTMISNWINAYNAAPLGAVAYAPTGNYIFSTMPTIQNPGIIRGDGTSTIFTHKAGSTGNGMVMGNMNYNPGYESVHFKDFVLKGNGSDGFGFYYPVASASAYLFLDNIRVDSWGSDGIRLISGQQTTLLDVVAVNNKNWGINFASDPVGSANASCIIGGSIAGNGTSNTVPGGLLVQNSQGLYVIGTAIQGNSVYDIYLGGTNAVVPQLLGVTFIGNYIQGNANTQYEMYVQGNVKQLCLFNVALIPSGPNTTGLFIDGGQAISPYQIRIHGGQISGVGTGNSIVCGPNVGGTVPIQGVWLDGTFVNGPISNTSTKAFNLMFLDQMVVTPVLVTNTTLFNASQTNYTGPSGVLTTVEANCGALVPRNGALYRLRVQMPVAPGVGNQVQFTVYKNGAATSMTAAITGTNTSAAYDGGVAVSAGDRISVQIVSSAGVPGDYAMILVAMV